MISFTVKILRKRSVFHSHFADGENEVQRLTDQISRGSRLEADDGTPD